MPVEGNENDREATMEFWMKLLTTQAMTTLGHNAIVTYGTDTGLWLIAPNGTAIAQENIIRKALAIQANRRLMQSHVPNEGIEVTIKMEGTKLWQGKVGLHHQPKKSKNDCNMP